MAKKKDTEKLMSQFTVPDDAMMLLLVQKMTTLKLTLMMTIKHLYEVTPSLRCPHSVIYTN